MIGIWNNNALLLALRAVLNISAPAAADKYLRLFVNNFTPASTDSIGAYTECTDSSYGPIHLVGSSWSLATVSGGEQASYASVTFAFATNQNLFGWYLTDAGNTLVYAAGTFATSPIAIPSGGGTLGVAVTLPAITP